MSTLPRTRALIRRLANLEEKDAAFPLPLLTSMYRAQLRAPMQALEDLVPQALLNATETFSRVEAVEEILAARYPALGWGEPFISSPIEAYSAFINQAGISDALDEALKPNDLLRDMAIYAEGNWVTYEPAIMCYRLTLSGTDTMSLCHIMEEMLGLNRDVEDMLIDLAGLV